MSRSTRKLLPKWVSSVYVLMSVILVPWIIFLAITLPTRHITKHYDLSWVGFDIGVMLSLLVTGLLAKVRSPAVSLSASSTATFLLVDAWFDIVTSTPGKELDQAIILAVFVEIPMSLISFFIAYRALIVLEKPKGT